MITKVASFSDFKKRYDTVVFFLEIIVSTFSRSLVVFALMGPYVFVTVKIQNSQRTV